MLNDEQLKALLAGTAVVKQDEGPTKEEFRARLEDHKRAILEGITVALNDEQYSADRWVEDLMRWASIRKGETQIEAASPSNLSGALRLLMDVATSISSPECGPSLSAVESVATLVTQILSHASVSDFPPPEQIVNFSPEFVASLIMSQTDFGDLPAPYDAPEDLLAAAIELSLSICKGLRALVEVIVTFQDVKCAMTMATLLQYVSEYESAHGPLQLSSPVDGRQGTSPLLILPLLMMSAARAEATHVAAGGKPFIP